MTAAPWILAIDFGTSFTVAAVKVGDRRAEVVEIGGERRMPSIVMTEDDGNLVVGRVAEHLAATNPSRTLRAPKSRLGDQAPVVLAGRPHQIADLVAGLLRYVYTEVTRQMGGEPSEVRLTHPAAWNRPRLNRLLEAAAKAGLSNVSLVPEPVGAALFYASEIGVPAGAHVAVYDLGGGTFDSAVVTSTGSGFTIIGRPGGDQTIGGELFDELLFNHVGERLPADAWYEIQVGEDPDWQQAAAALRNEVRRAKEALSSHPYAGLLVALPDGLEQLRITVDEYEQLITPYVDETITQLARTVENAGLATADLEAIYLVGGASRAPIVERAVTNRYPGVTVSRRGDPKTSVVLGAATAVQLGAPSAIPTDRPTQDAAPPTNPNPLVLGPPAGITPPPGAPSTPTTATPGHTSNPPGPPTAPPPARSGPASDPPGHTSVPPGPPPGAPGTVGAGSSFPPGSPPTTVHQAGAPSSPPVGAPGVQAFGQAAPVYAPPGGARPGAGGPGKKDPKQWYVLGGIAAVIVLIVVGVIAFGGGGGDEDRRTERTDRTERTERTDDTDPNPTEPNPTEPATTPDPTVVIPTTPPPVSTVGPAVVVPRTPEELEAGLLTDVEVNAEFQNAFVEVPSTASTEQFCGVVPAATPASQAIRIFTNSTGTAQLNSAIDRYATEEEAAAQIAQDQQFTTLCPSFTETIAGVEYNVTLAPFGDVVSATLEGQFAAVALVGFGTADASQTFSGFIIVKLDGANIVTIAGYRFGEVFDEIAIERFLSLMVTAFAKAGSVR